MLFRSKWTKKAEQLGIILSEKMVRGAEELKDQMTVLEYKLKATMNQMILTFGPQIGSLVEDLTKLVFEMTKEIVALAKKYGLIAKNQKDIQKEHISREERGKPLKQALAIAHSMKRKSNKERVLVKPTVYTYSKLKVLKLKIKRLLSSLGGRLLG